MEIKAAFALFDTDGDGYLSSDELRAILSRTLAETECCLLQLCEQDASYELDESLVSSVLLCAFYIRFLYCFALFEPGFCFALRFSNQFFVLF